jgi:8-oxo-dGTP diphosphatase
MLKMETVRGNLNCCKVTQEIIFIVMEKGEDCHTLLCQEYRIFRLRFRYSLLICNSGPGLLQLSSMMTKQLPNMLYTLCFLTRAQNGGSGEEVLMLHRQNPPNQGLWNGVGGHLEPGEAPRACILREVREETGYQLAEVAFRGVLTWDGFETPPGGLYIFMARAPEDDPLASATWECPEGRLEWKQRDWVLSSPEVVSNIHIFGPHVFGGSPPQHYHFTYQDGKIIRHEMKPLSNGWNVE